MPRKKKDERPESPDPALLQLRAEPPADDAYEAFESEIPAYLLAKVRMGRVGRVCEGGGEGEVRVRDLAWEMMDGVRKDAFSRRSPPFPPKLCG